jgi:hypothetical protein
LYPEQQYNIKDATQVQLMAEVLLNAVEYPWFQSYLIPNNYSEQIREEGWIFGQRIEGG